MGNNTQTWFSTLQNPTTSFTTGNYTIALNASNSYGYSISTQTTWINVTALPVASFTTNVTSGNAPFTIQLNDTSGWSASTLSTYAWSINNGTQTWFNGTESGMAENITYPISVAGTYNIFLSLTNTLGMTYQSSNITVTAITLLKPVTSYTTNISTYNDYPMTVAFTDTTSNSPNTWNYSFGDSYTSALQNPIHTYLVANTYTVTSNATNVNGYGTNASSQISLTSDLDSNVVSWMHYNTSATQDLIGNAWTANGGATISASTYKFGNGALSIQSNGAYISSGSSNVWNFGNGAGELEFWLYLTSNPNAFRNVISRTTGNGAGTNAGWGFGLNASGGATFWMGNEATAANDTPWFTVPTGAWHHYAITIPTTASGGNIIIYQDGVAVAALTRPAYSYDTANPLVIGNGAGPTNSQFYMDEFRMSTNTQRFTTSFSPPYAQYNGNLSAVNVNQNATLLYKSYPGYAQTITNTTSHVRTIQIQNITNATTITAAIQFNANEQFEKEGIPTANLTNYADLQINSFSDDDADGIVTVTVSRTSGLGISALFNNRTNLFDIPMYYINYTTANYFDTYFTSGSVYDSKNNIVDPVVTFYDTLVPIGTWTIYAGASAPTPYPPLNTPETYTDTSIGEPTGWVVDNWSWGDGSWSNSTGPYSPQHTYITAGITTITLYTTMIANTTITNSTTITVNSGFQPISSAFTIVPYAGQPGYYGFNDNSQGSPTTWNWSFGDQNQTSYSNPIYWNVSHSQSVVHQYINNGAYTVSLNVTNSSGSSSISSQALNVAAVPVANFTATPLNGSIPLTVQFNDTSILNPTTWAWNFGDSSLSTAWTQSAASTNLGGRYGAGMVSNGNTLTIMGGTIGGALTKNDVWNSTNNGASWTQVNSSAGWTGRSFFGSVIMPNGDIVIMGGLLYNEYNSAPSNDVWISYDNGNTWVQKTAHAAWAGRMGEGVITIGNTIYVVGGIGGLTGYGSSFTYLNDVWESPDEGATWVQVSPASNFGGRGLMGIVNYNGNIIVAGGYNGNALDDVWESSNNGVTFTQLPTPGWSARCEFNLLNTNNGLMVIGGSSSINLNVALAQGILAPENTNYDVWLSQNGGNSWVQSQVNAGWVTRGAQSASTLLNGNVVMGTGYGSGVYLGDFWYVSPSTQSYIQNPTHVYNNAGLYTVEMIAGNANGNSTPDIQYNYINVTQPTYNLNISVINAAFQPIPGAIATDEINGGTNYTVNYAGLITYAFHYPQTITLLISANGYSPYTSSDVYSNSTAITVQLSTASSTSTSQLNLLYPVQVQFQILDSYGNYLSNTSVTCAMLNSVNNNTNWFNTLFGISGSATSLNSTTLYGTTDSTGTVGFPMIGSAEYQLTFVNPVLGVNSVKIVTPIQNSYMYVLPDSLTGPVTQQGNVLLYSLSTYPPASQYPSTIYLFGNYSDSATETNSVNFYFTDYYGNLLYNLTVNNPSGNVSAQYAVANVNGQQYRWGFQAITNQFGTIQQDSGIMLQGNSDNGTSGNIFNKSCNDWACDNQGYGY